MPSPSVRYAIGSVSAQYTCYINFVQSGVWMFVSLEICGISSLIRGTPRLSVASFRDSKRDSMDSMRWMSAWPARRS